MQHHVSFVHGNMVSNCSHRERASLKAAIVVGKSECLRIQEPKTESGRVAGSVETGYNVMPENFWFPTGSKPLITTLAAGAEAPAWLNSQGGLLFIFKTTTGSLSNLGYPTSGGRPKTPFAQNACQARKSKVSLEICEIAFRTKLSFRNASISAVFVVTGAFRGFKWSLGLPHRCQPECRRNGFGNSRGFEGTRGKGLGPCSTGPNKPSSRETAPKSACKRPL